MIKIQNLFFLKIYSLAHIKIYKQDFYNIWKFDPLVDKSCIYLWNRPYNVCESDIYADRLNRHPPKRGLLQPA